MSMEDAIREHGASMKELASALRYAADRFNGIGFTMARHAEASASANPTAREAIQESLAKAVGLALAKARAGRTKDAELDKAVSKVEDDAKNEGGDAEASGATSPENGAGSVDVGDAEAAPLDYAKDIKPVLLAAIKKGKRAEIEAHLAAEGVKRADELPDEKLPELFALAQKLAA